MTQQRAREIFKLYPELTLDINDNGLIINGKSFHLIYYTLNDEDFTKVLDFAIEVYLGYAQEGIREL